MLKDLIVYQRVYDLILYAFPVINRFPRSQRFVLGQQIENAMVDLLGLLIKANKERDKRRTLFEADLMLDRLRMLIRLAHDMHFISMNRYEVFSGKLTEIGRLLGGWIGSCSGQPKKGQGY